MKKLTLFAAAASLLMASLPAGAQTTVRESTTTVQPAAPVTPTTTTTTVQPVEAVGTVTEFTPEAVVIRSQETAAPIRYSFSKTTEYVDESGNRSSQNVVKTGVPVTVTYVREGDRMLVNRVIVHQVAPAAPVVPVAPAPVTTEKTTTTTTTVEEGRRRHHDKDRDGDKDKN